MFFKAHSKNVLFFWNFFIKSYYNLKLFIYYVFVKKLELYIFLCFTCNLIIFGLYSWYLPGDRSIIIEIQNSLFSVKAGASLLEFRKLF